MALTPLIARGIIGQSWTAPVEVIMPYPDDKRAALSAARALNARPEAVVDAAFTSGDPFFDARDLVQVKYEMLRRVQVEGHAVTTTAAAFGFSRPSFYAAQAAWQAAGLPGLLPARPGPRGGHKLTAAVVAFLVEQRARDPHLRTAQLVALVQERFGLVVHPRSIERALARQTKKGRRASP
jgi:transposase